eukprot:2320123-Rhodomonas_salina.2
MMMNPNLSSHSSSSFNACAPPFPRNQSLARDREGARSFGRRGEERKKRRVGRGTERVERRERGREKERRERRGEERPPQRGTCCRKGRGRC